MRTSVEGTSAMEFDDFDMVFLLFDLIDTLYQSVLIVYCV